MKRARPGKKSVAPYTKYHKSPYKYPTWCAVGARYPEWLVAELRRVHLSTCRCYACR